MADLAKMDPDLVGAPGHRDHFHNTKLLPNLQDPKTGDGRLGPYVLLVSILVEIFDRDCNFTVRAFEMPADKRNIFFLDCAPLKFLHHQLLIVFSFGENNSSGRVSVQPMTGMQLKGTGIQIGRASCRERVYVLV